MKAHGTSFVVLVVLSATAWPRASMAHGVNQPGPEAAADPVMKPIAVSTDFAAPAHIF
jgi:hypothetical protein